MSIDLIDGNIKYSYPVLRITYYKPINYNIFDEIEIALNRANFGVEMLGGGEYRSGDKFSGNNDYIIESFDNFDLEFSREIIESIVDFKFDVEIFENDPFINTIQPIF